MDRDRLSEVRQTDLTESRINEEFVDWLKNKGPTYLLIGLVAILAVLFFMRFRENQRQEEVAAWDELRNAALPTALEDVAKEYEGIDSIAELARLRAADLHLQAVQSDYPVGGNVTTDPDLVLTAEQRESELAMAERLYQEVADADDGSMANTLIAVSALNGLAAVAEARGNLGQAGELYEAAAKRAEEYFPKLAQRSRDRAATAGELEDVGKFPTLAEIEPLRSEPIVGESISIDPAFTPLLLAPAGGRG